MEKRGRKLENDRIEFCAHGKNIPVRNIILQTRATIHKQKITLNGFSMSVFVRNVTE